MDCFRKGGNSKKGRKARIWFGHADLVNVPVSAITLVRPRRTR